MAVAEPFRGESKAEFLKNFHRLRKEINMLMMRDKRNIRVERRRRGVAIQYVGKIWHEYILYREIPKRTNI